MVPCSFGPLAHRLAHAQSHSQTNPDEICKVIDSHKDITDDEKTEIKASLQERKISILVVGKTGTGKSTILNAIVGEKVFEEGRSFDPVTSEVSGKEFVKNGITVTAWDSPGLEDGTENEEQYIRDMQTKCKDPDLLLYCISMKDTRADLDREDSALNKLTRALGREIWEHSLVVLTFANAVERRLLKTKRSKDIESDFDAQIELWKEKVKAALLAAGVEQTVVDRIPVEPAGHHKKPSLPGQNRQLWLSHIWTVAMENTREERQPLLITLNADRFKEAGDVKEDDFEKDAYKQPIIFTKKTSVAIGAVASAAGVGGAAVGAAVGAVLIGVPSFGVLAGVGLVVGGVIGGIGTGIAAAGIIEWYKRKKVRKEEAHTKKLQTST